ncbi:MAG: YqgE/AlgH family protein [Gammaproteobacteria bacterium]|nr:YqgE/AlgH family protein [Gammaproteobacteria bacterium]
MDPANSLKNHFLIAMPNLGDPNFYHTVTYICEHNDEGAMGIVINRPSATTLNDMLPQMGLKPTPQYMDLVVLEGGPVEQEHGFVIHTPTGEWQSSMSITDNVTLTTSRDILETLTQADGLDKFIIALGYAGWGAGQLEQEILENSWLTVPANEEILFDLSYSERWQAAANILGIDLNQLSSQAGHA